MTEVDDFRCFRLDSGYSITVDIDILIFRKMEVGTIQTKQTELFLHSRPHHTKARPQHIQTETRHIKTGPQTPPKRHCASHSSLHICFEFKPRYTSHDSIY